MLSSITAKIWEWGTIRHASLHCVIWQTNATSASSSQMGKLPSCIKMSPLKGLKLNRAKGRQWILVLLFGPAVITARAETMEFSRSPLALVGDSCLWKPENDPQESLAGTSLQLLRDGRKHHAQDLISKDSKYSQLCLFRYCLYSLNRLIMKVSVYWLSNNPLDGLLVPHTESNTTGTIPW